MPELILIAAVAANRAIGKDNRLLWQIPADSSGCEESSFN